MDFITPVFQWVTITSYLSMTTTTRKKKQRQPMRINNINQIMKKEIHVPCCGC